MSLAPGLDVLVQDQLGEWHKAVVLATVSATVSASSSSASIKEEHKEDDRYVLRLARSTRPLPRPVSASRLRRAGDGAPPAPASRPGNIVRVHSGEHAWCVAFVCKATETDLCVITWAKDKPAPARWISRTAAGLEHIFETSVYDERTATILRAFAPFVQLTDTDIAAPEGPRATSDLCALCKLPAKNPVLGPLVGSSPKLHVACSRWMSPRNGTSQTGRVKAADSMMCRVCKKPGASVWCKHSGCDQVYHFACSFEAQAVRFPGFHVLCQRHAAPAEDDQENHSEAGDKRKRLRQHDSDEALVKSPLACCSVPTVAGPIVSCVECGVRKHRRCIASRSSPLPPAEWLRPMTAQIAIEAHASLTDGDQPWWCDSCRRCAVCLKDDHDEHFITCSCCDVPYHSYCLETAPPHGSPWRCPKCALCISCDRPSPGDRLECDPCARSRQRGHACPVCSLVYHVSSSSAPLIKCASCKTCVHAECAQLSPQAFSTLITTGAAATYQCPVCVESCNVMLLNSLPPTSDPSESTKRAEATVTSSVQLAPNTIAPTTELCAGCFSLGRAGAERMIACQTCGESFHVFCAFPPDGASFALKEHKLQRLGWHCVSCLVCAVCEESAPEDHLLVCDSCERGYHTFCHKPSVNNVPSGLWVCADCSICWRCGDPTPDSSTSCSASSSSFSTLCKPCSAPADDQTCLMCFQSVHIFDLPTIECSNCRSIVHAHCDGIDRGVHEFLRAQKDLYRCMVCRVPSSKKVEDESESFVSLVAPMLVCQDLKSLKPDSRADTPATIAASLSSTPVPPSPLSPAPTSPSTASTCAFCGLPELVPGVDLGRFLVASRNSLAHLRCAMWSSKVSDAADGALQGIRHALSAARRQRCTSCKKFGASVACEPGSSASCSKLFHLPCAIQANADVCVLTHDMKLQCSRHHSSGGNCKGNEKLVQDVVPLSRAYPYLLPAVEDNNPTATAADWLRAGALTVLSIGSPTVHKISKKMRAAVGFSSTRLFWRRASSLLDVSPDSRCLFACSVEGPAQFKISWDDSSVVVGTTPNDALEKLLVLLGLDKRVGKMRRYRGDHFFGLSLPVIQREYKSRPVIASTNLRIFLVSLSGCARSEPVADRHKRRKVAASSSSSIRTALELQHEQEEIENASAKIGGMVFPMSMRYRQLRQQWKRRTQVGRSGIQGLGLFATENIEASEMCIEYVGEVVGNAVADKREKDYDQRGIGCYMFRLDPRRIVDATFTGNSARFINHSCDPNCSCRIISIDGELKIIIFAKYRIPAGTELTYDYMMAFEEDTKLPCHCGAANCRGYMN